MLYNVKEKKLINSVMCEKCEYKEGIKCKGIGKCCFLYDEKTGTLVDPLTRKPIKSRKEDE